MTLVVQCSEPRSNACALGAGRAGAFIRGAKMRCRLPNAIPGYPTSNPLGIAPTYIDGAMTKTKSSAICRLQSAMKAARTIARRAERIGVWRLSQLAMTGSDATAHIPLRECVSYTVLQLARPAHERKAAERLRDLSFMARLRRDRSRRSSGLDYLRADRLTMADIPTIFALRYGLHQLRLDLPATSRTASAISTPVMRAPLLARARTRSGLTARHANA